VTRRDTRTAAELVFRTFRRQHLEKFLPGLAKLGLRGLPDAVAAAQYHYLSNQLGPVRVEYVYESDRKAWIRYVPPRWIWEGAAICGVPSEVSRAMLRGWQIHLHGGLDGPPSPQRSERRGKAVALLDPRRRACTALTADERLRFAPGEEAPDFDPARAPRLEGAEWPRERLRKIERNYAMDYVRNILPELVALVGPAEARYLGGVTATLIGMQYYAETAALLGVTGDSAADFATYFGAMAAAQGDRVASGEESGATVIRQTTWHLMAGVHAPHPALFDIWNALWEGALAVHNRRLALVVRRRRDFGDDAFEWWVRTRR
jgi:hypothetical protein